jgi:8-oxo-dGTP pyrophosphatase MutT (NUDIX family)
MVSLNFRKIKEKIQNRIPGSTRNQHYYSVLLPLICIEGKMHLVYEVRSENLSRQPGQISFPGGRVERGEEFSQAAVRECSEELLIDKNQIELLGEIDYLITPFNFIIYVFVGRLKLEDLSQIIVNNYEVDEIFSVPIDYFLENDVEKYSAVLKSEFDDDFPYHLIPQGKKHNQKRGAYEIYFYRYNGRIIWGITAEITKNFIDIIKDN